MFRFRNAWYVYKIKSTYVLWLIFDSDHSKFIPNIYFVTLKFLCEIIFFLIINLLYIQVQFYLIVSVFLRKLSIFDRFPGIFFAFVISYIFFQSTLHTPENDNQKRMLMTYSKLAEIIWSNKNLFAVITFHFRTHKCTSGTNFLPNNWSSIIWINI